jgi:uncharacterized protein YegP (UPF0339 family)
MPGTFQIFKDRSERWRFRLKDESGKVVANGPQGYASKHEVEKIVSGIKEAANQPIEIDDEDATN